MYAATLCEVVVIGHKHSSCQRCPSTSECNDVIGCEACDPGKQQPDCDTPCAPGTFGKNCEGICEHCKDKISCDIKDGQCVGGCATWYTSKDCETYIDTPMFETTDKPQVEYLSGSTVTVTWPKPRNIPSVLENHYYYIVWLQTDGGETVTSGTSRLETRVTGLKFNRRYSVKVVPYRQHNDLRESGTSTEVAWFKTRCMAPSIPTIETAMIWANSGHSTDASISVMWKTLNESGCDRMTRVVVWYQRMTATTDTWSYKAAENVDQTHLIIDGLVYQPYRVKVTATNNENINSSSETFNANLIETRSLAANPTARVVADGLGTVPWIGIAVATFILGVVIMAVVLGVILRKRSNQRNTDKKVHRRGQPPIEMRTGADNEDYTHSTRVSREQRRSDVYDVINA